MAAWVAEHRAHDSVVVSQLRFAEQYTVTPPPEPTQGQEYGPEPVTAPAVPALQSPDDGADRKLWPCDDPQEPAMTWVQDALDTPQLPSLQVDTAEPVQPPAPLVMAPLKPWSCAERDDEQPSPHASEVAPQLLCELHDALAPPPWPVQVQVKGPAPDTVPAVPDAQSPAVGALAVLPPSAAPQDAVMICVHEALDTLHAPWSQVVVAEPVQPGVRLATVPLDPWAPGARDAEQLPSPHATVAPAHERSALHVASAPPPAPAQVHVKGPSPLTPPGSPAAQNPVTGAPRVL